MELIPEESSTEMGASNAGQTDCNFSRIHPQIVFFNVAEFSHLRMYVLHFVGFCFVLLDFLFLGFCFVGIFFPGLNFKP
jgi:hypothetical protein